MPFEACSTSPSSPLLCLPFEIRHAILRELLWTSEALGLRTFMRNEDRLYGINQGLTHGDCEDCKHAIQPVPYPSPVYPQILSVCKQLYAEGLPILHRNSMYCRIGMQRNYLGTPRGMIGTNGKPTILGETFCECDTHLGQCRCPNMRTPDQGFPRVGRAVLHICTADPALTGHKREWDYLPDDINRICQVLCRASVKHVAVHIKFHALRDERQSLEALYEHTAADLQHHLSKFIALLDQQTVSWIGHSTHVLLPRPTDDKSDMCPEEMPHRCNDLAQKLLDLEETTGLERAIPEHREAHALFRSFCYRQLTTLKHCLEQSDVVGFYRHHYLLTEELQRLKSSAEFLSSRVNVDTDLLRRKLREVRPYAPDGRGRIEDSTWDTERPRDLGRGVNAQCCITLSEAEIEKFGFDFDALLDPDIDNAFNFGDSPDEDATDHFQLEDLFRNKMSERILTTLDRAGPC